jgi:predicted Ser/Thr protein kinase
MEEATPVDKKPVVAGTVLKGRWKLVQKIGQGAFGEIFSGNDQTTLDPVAVKLERWDSKKAVLKMEVRAHSPTRQPARAPCSLFFHVAPEQTLV